MKPDLNCDRGYLQSYILAKWDVSVVDGMLKSNEL